MSASSMPVVPPAPPVHARELPVWRLLSQISKNTLGIFSEEAFTTTIKRRQVFSIESYLINDPEGVRHVLTSNAMNYVKPMSMTRSIRPLVGDGVVLAEGHDWKRQRRAVAPSFTPANVAVLLPHFMEAAASLMRMLDGQPSVNLAARFQEATLEAVLRSLFTLPDSDERGHMAAMVNDYLAGPGRPTVLDGFAKSETAFAFATKRRKDFQAKWTAAVDAIIAERRRNSAQRQYNDLLNLMLNAETDGKTGRLSDAEIRDQCATMIFAGYETTGRLLFWSTYMLTLAPAEQELLRDEIAAFPPDRVTEMSDLRNWPRLKQTLLETLRLYPPAPHVVRQAVEEDQVLGHTIKPGTQVWISPWVIQRHRKYWDHPTAFMPERFEGKPSPWTNGSPYLPFGAGPRICIGATFSIAEAQIMLAALLSRYRITQSDNRPVLPVGTLLVAPDIEPTFNLERL